MYCPSLQSGQYCHPRTEYSPVLPSQSCNNICCSVLFCVVQYLCCDCGTWHVALCRECCSAHVALCRECCSAHVALYRECCSAHVALCRECCSAHLALCHECCSAHVALCRECCSAHVTLCRECCSAHVARYVRALGAMYLRLVGDTMECYNYLEPLYNDYRKLKKMNRDGSEITWAGCSLGQPSRESGTSSVLLNHIV